MGIWMRNSTQDINNKVDYKIYHEHIAEGHVLRKLEGTLTVPSRSNRQFHWIYLVCDSNGGSKGITIVPEHTTPQRDLYRVIGAWGTEPDDTNLIRQVQTDRVVQYRGDYVFDGDLVNCWTGGSWIERGSYGAWPGGLCAAAYFRLEASRAYGVDNNGLGLAQINVNMSDDNGSWDFRTQVKALTRHDQPEASDDQVRCLLHPGSSTYGLMTSNDCRGWLLVSGYELMPT